MVHSNFRSNFPARDDTCDFPDRPAEPRVYPLVRGSIRLRTHYRGEALELATPKEDGLEALAGSGR